jgi:hypothetical protein
MPFVSGIETPDRRMNDGIKRHIRRSATAGISIWRRFGTVQECQLGKHRDCRCQTVPVPICADRECPAHLAGSAVTAFCEGSETFATRYLPPGESGGTMLGDGQSQIGGLASCAFAANSCNSAARLFGLFVRNRAARWRCCAGVRKYRDGIVVYRSNGGGDHAG